MRCLQHHIGRGRVQHRQVEPGHAIRRRIRRQHRGRPAAWCRDSNGHGADRLAVAEHQVVRIDQQRADLAARRREINGAGQRKAGSAGHFREAAITARPGTFGADRARHLGRLRAQHRDLAAIALDGGIGGNPGAGLDRRFRSGQLRRDARATLGARQGSTKSNHAATGLARRIDACCGTDRHRPGSVNRNLAALLSGRRSGDGDLPVHPYIPSTALHHYGAGTCADAIGLNCAAS